MPVLVLNAPTMQAVLRQARDFDTVLKLQVGEAYCFTDGEARAIRRGWDVIVLDKTRRRRADGKVIGLDAVGNNPPCASGRARYDVRLEGLDEVDDYDAPLPPLVVAPKRCKDGSLCLNRGGVAILR
jgi:hypothetical protein